MDNLFPHDPYRDAASPSNPAPSTSQSAPFEKADEVERKSLVAASAPLIPTPDSAVVKPEAQPPQVDRQKIPSPATVEREPNEPRSFSVPSLPTMKPATERSESSKIQPVSEPTEKDATARPLKASIDCDPSIVKHGENRLDQKAPAQSDQNPTSVISSGVASDAHRRSEIRPADPREGQASLDDRHAAVRARVANDPAFVPDEFPEDSPADLKRIAQRILARRVGCIPQRQVEANASRIRGLKSLGLKVKEIYTDLVIEGRINADKVSYKQFADQVKKLTT